jgi:hypothetical protein
MLTGKQKIDLPVKSTKIVISKIKPYLKRDNSETQLSNMIIDPNNSSPPNDFMDGLKHRMNIYYAVEEK